MGQDWKTLSVVVVAAAIAGWWMVRGLGGKTPEPVVPPVAVGSAPAAAETAARLGVAATPTAKPAAPPPSSADVPAAVDEDTEVALIQRDLALLHQALVRDQRIEDRVMPRVNDVVEVPGVVPYRRAPDFWEPALAVAKERKP